MYVDNQKFYAAMTEFIYKCREAKSNGAERPEIPNYIGDCIIKITTGLGHTHGFRNYSFLDDMKADAIENCVRYVDRFDPDRFDNPFSYFTQISYYAFTRRITKEKKQAIVKGTLMANAPLMALEMADHGAGDSDNADLYNNIQELMQDYIKDEYVYVAPQKEQKKVSGGLDEFLEDE